MNMDIKSFSKDFAKKKTDGNTYIKMNFYDI